MSHPHAELIRQFLEDPTLVVQKNFGAADDDWGLSQWNNVINDIDGNHEFRLKPEKDSIDLDHVKSVFKYMARDEGGDVYLYANEPEINRSGGVWSCTGAYSSANSFSSYEKGNSKWDKSLVSRGNK